MYAPPPLQERYPREHGAGAVDRQDTRVQSRHLKQAHTHQHGVHKETGHGKGCMREEPVEVTVEVKVVDKVVGQGEAREHSDAAVATAIHHAVVLPEEDARDYIHV